MPKSLLLADDSATIQTAVQMTFKAEDVTLTVVSDGNEALARAKAVKPDLILADVEMPGVGGYELCAKLRGDAATRHIPVLLLGGGTPVDPAKAIAVGANGHMAKPFDSQKLIDQVKQILANPKAMPAAAAPARPSAPPQAAPARPSAPPQAAPGTRPAAPAQGGSGPARPAAPVSRPPTPGARPPQPGGAPANTLTMARPPTAPGMRPAGPPSRPPGTAPVGPRPAAPTSRPPGAVPPGARPSQPAAARAPLAPGARPPAPAAARPPGARPPGPPARPAPAQTRPPVPQPPQQTLRHALPGQDDDLPMEVDEFVEESAASPASLRPVPAPASRQPSLSVVPDGKGAAGDGGEALLREALSRASREVIEKIAWEVVPELAETIIREELERLMKERGA